MTDGVGPSSVFQEQATRQLGELPREQLEAILKAKLEEIDNLHAHMKSGAAQLEKLSKEKATINAQLDDACRSVEKLQAAVEALQSTNKKNPAPVRLPTFDPFYGKPGENARGWLFIMDQALALGEYNDNYKITAAGFNMRQAAKIWFESVRSDPERPEYVATWTDFKAAMLENFAPVNPTKAARDKLAALTQTSSVNEYTAAFRNLCAQIPSISEDEKLDRYVRGLRTNTRAKVRQEDPSTFDQAARLAENFDANYATNFTLKPKTWQGRGNGSTPMELGSIQQQSQDGCMGCHNMHGQRAMHNNRAAPFQHQDHSMQPSKSQHAIMQERRDKGWCLYCGSDKHRVKDCPKAPPRKVFDQGNAKQ